MFVSFQNNFAITKSSKTYIYLLTKEVKWGRWNCWLREGSGNIPLMFGVLYLFLHLCINISPLKEITGDQEPLEFRNFLTEYII